MTGTDLDDLQFDALATSTAANTQMPASPLASKNKAFKTTNKTAVGAVNEVFASTTQTSTAFTAFTNKYNTVLGDSDATPALLTDLQKIDANVLLSVVAVYKSVHGPDLDNPVALPGDIATILLDLQSKEHTHSNKSALDAVTGVNTGDQDLSGLALKVHQHVIADIDGLVSALAAKEATIAAGTASQVWRGDKTWVTLGTDIVPEGTTNKYFTDARVAAYIAANNNAANKVVVAGPDGKIPSSLLAAGGGLVNKGTWNATTNTPALTSTPPADSSGWFYIVSNPGDQFGNTWNSGDWIISDGSAWQHIDNVNNPNAVTSVFGRLGPTITAQADDYASFYVSLSGSYANPTWITSLASSKISGVLGTSQLGTGTADNTKYLRGDGTWATITLTGGTVTSVDLVLPAEFSVTGSPVTTSGTLTAAWASQTAGFVLAAPAAAAGTPGFRALVATDIPALDAAKITTGTFTAAQIPGLDVSKIVSGVFSPSMLGTGSRDGSKFLRDDGVWTTVVSSGGTVTSVGLAAPAEFSVLGTPVTSAGNITLAWANVGTQGYVLASPANSSGTPSFRALTATDIPVLDASKITTGVFNTARLGTGTATSSTFLRGDGTWYVLNLTSGTVSSVGLAMPVEFAVSNSPITTSGTFTVTWANQTGNTFFAGPAASPSGAPSFRALVVDDIPALDAAKITTGTFNALRIPDLDASKIVSGVLSPGRVGSGTRDGSRFLRDDGVWTSIALNNGTVTSVALATPVDFVVTGSPVTTTGTLTFAWAPTAAGNLVMAAPDGTSGTPGFRSLVSADIPSLPASKISSGVLGTARLGTGTADSSTYLRGDGTWAAVSVSAVTSVGLAAPAEFVVSNSPVTSVGNLTLAWATVNTAGLVFASPSATSGTPGFRALIATDIPGLDAAKIVSGVLNTARLGSGTADSTKYLRGDGTWSTITVSGGTVTSVALTLPAEFSVSGSPVTTAGTLAAAWANQTANIVFAGPASGGVAAPGFRTLVAGDIPSLSAAKITSGVFDVSLIPDLDAAKIISGTLGTGRIPGLDAAKIVSGVFSPAQLGSGARDGTKYLRDDGVWSVLSGVGSGNTLTDTLYGTAGAEFSTGALVLVTQGSGSTLAQTYTRGGDLSLAGNSGRANLRIMGSISADTAGVGPGLSFAGVSTGVGATGGGMLLQLATDNGLDIYSWNNTAWIKKSQINAAGMIAVVGGTAAGFLKANGTIDTTGYLTSINPTYTGRLTGPEQYLENDGQILLAIRRPGGQSGRIHGIAFQAQTLNGTWAEFGRVMTYISSVADGAQSGGMRLMAYDAGTIVQALDAGPTGVTFAGLLSGPRATLTEFGTMAAMPGDSNYATLHATGVTRTSTNYALRLADDGTNTLVNASSDVALAIAGTAKLGVTTSAVNLGSGVALQINATTVIDSSRNAAFAGLTTTGNPTFGSTPGSSSVNINSGAGTASSLNFLDNSVTRATLQLYTSNVFRLVARDTAGIEIDSPIYVDLTAGGEITIGGTSRVTNFKNALEMNGVVFVDSSRNGSFANLTASGILTLPDINIRTYTVNSYGAVYGSSVTPSATNYGLIIAKDGSTAQLNGTTASYLNVNDVAVVKASVGKAEIVGSLSMNTGDISFANSGTNIRGVYGTVGDNDSWRVGGGATATNAGYLEIATADDGNEPIYFRQYSGTFSSPTSTRTLTLMDNAGNTSFPGQLTLTRSGSDTYTVTAMIADATTGLVIERGRASNSSSAAIRSFTISQRGGGTNYFEVADGTTYSRQLLSVDSNIACTGYVKPGGVEFSTYGTCGIYNGNADAVSYTQYNFKIKSGWGIGFESYDAVTRCILDTRTGNLSTLGTVTANSITASSATFNGDISFSNSGTTLRAIKGTMGDNDFWRVGGGATATNAGYMEIATADDGNEPIYVRQYTGVFTSLTRTLTLLDDSGNTSVPGNLAANGSVRAGSSNVAMMTKWVGGNAAVFCYSSYNTSSDYGMIQDLSGLTRLNSASQVEICNAGTANIVVTSAGIHTRKQIRIGGNDGGSSIYPGMLVSSPIDWADANTNESYYLVTGSGLTLPTPVARRMVFLEGQSLGPVTNRIRVPSGVSWGVHYRNSSTGERLYIGAGQSLDVYSMAGFLVGGNDGKWHLLLV